jgi:hypothetical protein
MSNKIAVTEDKIHRPILVLVDTLRDDSQNPRVLIRIDDTTIGSLPRWWMKGNFAAFLQRQLL